MKKPYIKSFVHDVLHYTAFSLLVIALIIGVVAGGQALIRILVQLGFPGLDATGSLTNVKILIPYMAHFAVGFVVFDLVDTLLMRDADKSGK